MEKQINEDEFRLWYGDPITQAYIKHLKSLIDTANVSLSEEEHIFMANGEKIIARLIGYKDGIADALDIKYEDVIEEEDNE